LLRADRVLTVSIEAKTTNSLDLAFNRISLRRLLFHCLMESGPAHLPAATQHANALLARLPSTNSPNYGINLFIAHELLGHVELQEDRPQTARNQLRESDQAPLDFQEFAPSHQLARQVLKHGEPADCEAVLAYLASCTNTWTTWASSTKLAPGTNERYLNPIVKWMDQIREGKTPDSPVWR